jgi:hypothetical protein
MGKGMALEEPQWAVPGGPMQPGEGRRVDDGMPHVGSCFPSRSRDHRAMARVFQRVAPGRAGRVALAGLALLAGLQAAAAAEASGLDWFFASVFGDRHAQRRATPGQIHGRVSAGFRARSLTVRLHSAQPRTVAAQVPTRPGRVSIYADSTLRPGDAVMMADGIHVFAGSNAWPYTNDDFVGLSAARHMDRATAKVLAAIDRLPRG